MLNIKNRLYCLFFGFVIYACSDDGYITNPHSVAAVKIEKSLSQEHKEKSFDGVASFVKKIPAVRKKHFANSIALRGKITTALPGIDIYAEVSRGLGDTDLETKGKVSTVIYHTVTDSNGFFSLDIPVVDLNAMVFLKAIQSETLLYFSSILGTVKKLNSLQSQNGVVDFSDYMPLELSPLSTALTVYMEQSNKNEVIDTDQIMDARRLLVDGVDVIKLATLIDEILEGDSILPIEKVALVDLFSDSVALKELVTKFSYIDNTKSILRMLNKLSTLNTDEFGLGNKGALYTNRGISSDGRPVGTFYSSRGGDIVEVNSKLFLESYFSDISKSVHIDHSMRIIEDGLSIKLMPASANGVKFQFDSVSINGCGKKYDVVVNLNQIELLPIYISDDIAQYIIKFDGTNRINESYYESCGIPSFIDWSQVKLVNLIKKKKPIALDKDDGDRTIAVRVGNYFDINDSYSNSASLINLKMDGTFILELDGSKGNWYIEESGDLRLNFSNESTIIYTSIRQSKDFIVYMAKRTNADGKSRVFAGNLVSLDEELNVQSLVGRYEYYMTKGLKESFAYSFQTNGYGRRENRDENARWISSIGSQEQLYHFRWSADTSGFGLKSQYFSKRKKDSALDIDGTNCSVMDRHCFIWRQQNFRVLKVEGETIYVLVNILLDNEVFSRKANDVHHSDYVGRFIKTDFVLSPVN